MSYRRKSKKDMWIYIILIAICFGIIEIIVRYWYVFVPVVVIIVALAVRKIKKKAKQEEIYRRSAYASIDIDAFDGPQFERFCAQLLIDNGYSAKVTKVSGDHGIDVVAKKNGVTYDIQCKHFSNKVGNKAIQEAYSGRAIYGGDCAVAMTNNYFTKQAISDAARLNVILWDRNSVLALMKNAAIDTKASMEIGKTLVNDAEMEKYDDGYPKTYDRIREMYLEGVYIVGDDIPKGRYRVVVVNDAEIGEVLLYETEEDFDKNKSSIIKVKDRYPLELSLLGMYVELIGVEMKLVRELK